MKKSARNLFIPNKANAYQPNILQRMSIGVMAVLVLFTFATANIHALIWIGSDWLVSAVLPSVLVELTNDERSSESLGTLRQNETLSRAATLKAEHMAQHEYFSHYSPDGTSPWHWFGEVSYDFVHAGENLAVHFTDSEDVVKAWMQSPSHRDNILGDQYAEIGIGTAQGQYKGFPTVYVVQLFGTPAAPSENNTQPIVLAESVSEPEAITIETERVLENDPEAPVAPITLETIPLNDTDATNAARTEPLSEDIPQLEETVVIYSDLATTSVGSVPAILDDTMPKTTTQVGVFSRMALTSNVWLSWFYAALALFVFVALSLSIVIEWRRQHPVQIAYGTGLLATMALLSYVHTVLTNGVVII